MSLGHPPMWIDAGVPVPENSAVLAAALARLPAYLRRAQPVNDADELIARDAFVSGFLQGGRYVMRASAELAGLQPALLRLLMFLDGEASACQD